MLLGKDGEVFDPEKLSEMSENFSMYKSATSNDFATGGSGGSVASSSQSTGAPEAELAMAKILLSPDGNFMQDLLMESKYIV